MFSFASERFFIQTADVDARRRLLLRERLKANPEGTQTNADKLGYFICVYPRPSAVPFTQHFLPTSNSTAYQPPPQTPSVAD
jgi:hypothetical protein